MVNFERFISRNLALRLSGEMALAGVKWSINKLVELMVVPGAVIFVAVASLLSLAMHVQILLAGGLGVTGWVLFAAIIYLILEYRIDRRKTRVEEILPDYFMLTAANLRSGISLDRSLLLAAKPEFAPLSEDMKELARKLFSGETMELALNELGRKYRSIQLQHSVRMITESIRYGGAIADLLNQLSKDLRAQHMAQKEIAGQMLMYSIFIVFAGIIAAPVLYGLTSQMITITTKVWSQISVQNLGSIPSSGLSFLKPRAPQITVSQYGNFSIIAIIIITGFSSLIMSAMSNGSIVKGLRYVPVFIIVGLLIYVVVGSVIGALFANIGAL